MRRFLCALVGHPLRDMPSVWYAPWKSCWCALRAVRWFVP